jgi:RNA polymerase sigma-70 factor (ECF subfamily)
MQAVQERDDEWLMGQVARGQREQLAPLVRRYANRLLTFIRRMVGDEHQSEELFQEVFLTVWVKRHQYSSPRPFKSWLYAIAVNKCREAHRRRDFLTLPSLSDYTAVPFEREPPPDARMVATETATLVGKAVALLPPQQRAVVVLRIWDGMSYADIAEVVGRSEGTVRSNMHHGLAAMRKYLEPRLK